MKNIRQTRALQEGYRGLPENIFLEIKVCDLRPFESRKFCRFVAVFGQLVTRDAKPWIASLELVPGDLLRVAHTNVHRCADCNIPTVLGIPYTGNHQFTAPSRYLSSKSNSRHILLIFHQTLTFAIFTARECGYGNVFGRICLSVLFCSCCNC